MTCPCGGELAPVDTCSRCGEMWLSREACIALDAARKTDLERQRDEARAALQHYKTQAEELAEANAHALKDAAALRERLAQREAQLESAITAGNQMCDRATTAERERDEARGEAKDFKDSYESLDAFAQRQDAKLTAAESALQQERELHQADIDKVWRPALAAERQQRERLEGALRLIKQTAASPRPEESVTLRTLLHAIHNDATAALTPPPPQGTEPRGFLLNNGSSLRYHIAPAATPKAPEEGE